MSDQPWDIRRQYIVYAAIALLSVGLTAALIPSLGYFYRRFLGGTNPLFVVVLAAVAGGFALQLLRKLAGMEILRRGSTLRGIAISAVLAALFSAEIIIFDAFIRSFPEDINAPLPQAIGFYPSIGFVAEIIFFVVPLSLILLLFSLLRRWIKWERLVWLGITLTALLEPTFQVILGSPSITWGDLYTWLHIYAISFFQLWLLKRYDFVSMYSLRLFYYACWHIIWGALRLELLF